MKPSEWQTCTQRIDAFMREPSLVGEALNLLKDRPLFPCLSRVRAGDRATEFKQRCQQLKISGVMLHSNR
jgi:hypothetical protein